MVGTVTASRETVLKIERYRLGGWGRGKTAAVGALIGFGGGFAIGAAAVVVTQATFDLASRAVLCVQGSESQVR